MSLRKRSPKRARHLAAVGVVTLATVFVPAPSIASEVVDTLDFLVTLDGSSPDGDSSGAALSADGSVVAYMSWATNLAPDDANAAADIFTFDFGTGRTTRVSMAADGSEADGSSWSPRLSSDGALVTYVSAATNLVADDTNDEFDVFITDVEAGTNRRVSTAHAGGNPDGLSISPDLSADGNIVTYVSNASNLTVGDTNESGDVFLFSVKDGTTRRVSVSSIGGQGDGDSSAPSVNADGSVVAFSSFATNLVDGDTNGASDVFVHRTDTGTTTRISVASAGTQADKASYSPAITADGERVVFASEATNLADGDSNGITDIFVHDLATGATTRMSSDSLDGSISVGNVDPVISGNSAVVMYTMLLGDYKIQETLVAQAIATGERLVVSTGHAEPIFDDVAFEPTISADGTRSANSLASPSVTFVFGRDVNWTPAVLGFTTSLGEDTPPGTALGTVTAIDVDPVAFAISSGDPDGRFSIHADTGVITLERQLDFAASTQHRLTVTASDGSLVGEDIVTVNVKDPNPFDDDDGSIFEADIEWLADSGITSGCGFRMFCPSVIVTRGQMAAFLKRALDLPATAHDYFSDDDGSLFEDDINRLAEAGITTGCRVDAFCPDMPVTREQMAAFLVRAFGYSDMGPGDVFVDDDASIFATDIDKLATAKVTLGCNPPANDRFCPFLVLTREQMAALLHRAMTGP